MIKETGQKYLVFYVIGNIIKVVNFNNYRIDKDGMDVSISLPEVSSDSKDLEYKLNKEFEKEGKEAYKKYEAEVAELEKEGKTTHKSAEMWTESIAENDKTLSVAIYNTETEASAATSRKIYNIDKKDKTILTLEGMFGNNDYVDVLSKNILSQMKERTKKDSNDVYFVDNTFKIKKDQPFYINDKGELVICFDEYEVAPGSAGLVEFVIPSNVVSKLMKQFDKQINNKNYPTNTTKINNNKQNIHKITQTQQKTVTHLVAVFLQ